MKAFGIMGRPRGDLEGDDSRVATGVAAQRKTRRAWLRAGFQAEQISLTRTPCLTGPVNRHAGDLSTAVNRHAGHDAPA
jgi:hypothetical protein